MNLHRQPAAFLIILLHLYFCLLLLFFIFFVGFEFRQNLISVFCAVGKKIMQNVLHRQLGQFVSVSVCHVGRLYTCLA